MHQGTAAGCANGYHDVPHGARFCVRCGADTQAATGATQRLNTGPTERLRPDPAYSAASGALVLGSRDANLEYLAGLRAQGSLVGYIVQDGYLCSPWGSVVGRIIEDVWSYTETRSVKHFDHFLTAGSATFVVSVNQNGTVE